MTYIEKSFTHEILRQLGRIDRNADFICRGKFSEHEFDRANDRIYRALLLLRYYCNGSWRRVELYLIEHKLDFIADIFNIGEPNE
jgi:hypothetical protein